jgi:alpha-D-ribose 1-methylphosphonate 5-triphosphate synthase subunit PhnH
MTQDILPPAGIEAATASALLTLADYETPIWIPPSLRDTAAGAWLRFHCGAMLVTDPQAAVFAVVDGMSNEPSLAAFNPGTDQFPDRSTTIIVQCSTLEGGDAVALTGPGIERSRVIAPSGLRANFWEEAAVNAALYPVGIDIILSCGNSVIGLPRSTQIKKVR